MLFIRSIINNQADTIRKFEDHGIGRKALCKYAMGEFMWEMKDIQRSADTNHTEIRLELIDTERGLLVHSTAKPILTMINNQLP